MIERAMALAKAWRAADRFGEIVARAAIAGSGARPWARPAAIAEASVQPVPWVWRVSMRGLSRT